MGFRYRSRMLAGDFLLPLQRGVLIAAIVTALAPLLSVPLGFALARL
jgi:ABC-type spermidine/putrescine transport system permease subunit II